ncbi:MAG: phosphodiester glycosidase family protein [Rivularia sp. (in: Bacteria)]|nr:phosphodiester glycosidase family protein [Rivularia sp. MS3]
MVKKLTLGQNKNRITMDNRNSIFVKIMALPILAIMLNLTATSITRAKPTSYEATGNTPSNQSLLISTSNSSLFQGNQISINGRTLPGNWVQHKGKSQKAPVVTYISDAALRQLIGVDLLSSDNPQLQPIQWFSSQSKPQVLTGFLEQGYRYLDITKFARKARWKVQAKDNTLVIFTPKAKVKTIKQEKSSFEQQQLVIDLNRPTPWKLTAGSLIKKPKPKPQVQPQPKPKVPQLPFSRRSVVINTDIPVAKPKPELPAREWIITIDGVADDNLVSRYTPAPSIPQPIQLDNPFNKIPLPVLKKSASEPLIKKVEVVNNQTVIRLVVPFGLTPRVSTLPKPHRLIVDIRPDALVGRSIDWAPGLRWRQQLISLGNDRFPVIWLEVNPSTSKVKIRPVATNQDKQEGTAPLIKTARKYLAAAAINGGFFNRKNRLPLGAIRRDNQWFSGPILNRGAIAWNDAGQFYMNRLSLQENLIFSDNQKLPITHLNSGYVKQGIARYTHLWGQNYTPLTDNEIIVAVQNNKVIQQYAGAKAGDGFAPIPKNGYLLALRASAVNNAAKFQIGTPLRLVSSAVSPEFNRYPHVLGAGPLLLKDNQIVLDARAENFSQAFAEQKAIRSAICTTNSGKLIVAAVHDRAGGKGPSLSEHAQLMQQLGCVNALNLDGGSSTSLYLGGQLLDRSPNTAASVHNGIGIFLPRP